MDQYEFLEEIGRGASSTVLRAKCKTSRREVAVKRIDLDSLNCDLVRARWAEECIRVKLGGIERFVRPLACSATSAPPCCCMPGLASRACGPDHDATQPNLCSECSLMGACLLVWLSHQRCTPLLTNPPRNVQR